MKTPLKIFAAALCGLLLGLPLAQAQDEWPITDVYIQMGNDENAMSIEPREITLHKGEVYRFVVTNSSNTTHIVAATGLRDAVLSSELFKWSATGEYPALVLAAGISLYPGETMEWTFVTFEKGTYKFGCDDPIHAAAGMQTIVKVVS